MTELCLSCHRLMSFGSVSSQMQALQNPCIWATVGFFSFLVLRFTEEQLNFCYDREDKSHLPSPLGWEPKFAMLAERPEAK